MEKSTFSSAAISDPTVKKLYRASMDCVKLLDQNMKGKSDAHVVANLTSTRNRLRECCERLLFLNPLEFGRKADELLWRKCHYEPIKILRQHSVVLSNENKCFLNTMLTSAIGYYQILALKLRRTFPNEDDSSMMEDEFRACPIARTDRSKSTTVVVDEKLRDWVIGERHRLLIYQGDLARYLYECDGNVDMGTAEHYYHQALALRPNQGTPYHRLGTLFLAINHGLDAMYYYLRSSCSEENFAGAEENLLSVLNKNEQLMQANANETTIGSDPKSDFKHFVTTYLATARIFYLDEAQNNNDDTVQQYCSKTIRAFHVVLKHLNSIDQQTQKSNDGPSNDVDRSVASSGILDFELLIKLFVAQITLVGRLQSKGSLKLSPAIALLLSMFSNFLNHVVDHFCNDLAENGDQIESGESKPLVKPSITAVSTAMLDRNSNSIAAPSVSRKTKKPNLTRRRRRGDSDEDEDEENIEEQSESSEDDSSIRSENELNGGHSGLPSDSDSDDDVIEITPDLDSSIAKVLAAQHDAPKSTKMDESSGRTATTEGADSRSSEIPDANGRKPWHDLSTSEQLENLSTYELLVPLKIVCDWFRCNENFTVMVQQSASEIWSVFARILNFLPDERQLTSHVENSGSKLQAELKQTPNRILDDWTQKFPLPEDVMVRGVPSMKQLHSALDYKSVVCGSLEAEAIIRICCLRSFGHHLIRSNTPNFRFDRARMEFIANNGQTAIIQDNSTELDKKNALMRSMAQLRLKSEMESAEQLAWIPVYLIPDATSLCQKLPAIKRLASAQKFIIIIPTATINELDRLKKDQGSARSATRWLEGQFSRGNKFVRVQKSNERDDSLVVTSGSGDTEDGGGRGRDVPKSFVELVKCASQLRKSVKAGTTSGSTIVTVLTNYAKHCAEFERMEKILQATALSGVTLVNVGHFAHKWESHRKNKTS